MYNSSLFFGCFHCFPQLPDYHDIIEHPMDFGTLRKKLDGGVYSCLEQFEVGLACIITF